MNIEILTNKNESVEKIKTMQKEEMEVYQGSRPESSNFSDGFLGIFFLLGVLAPLGDVLVLDRGYFSYLILVKAIEKGVHLICVACIVNKAVQAFWDSDKEDEVINYIPL